MHSSYSLRVWRCKQNQPSLILTFPYVRYSQREKLLDNGIIGKYPQILKHLTVSLSGFRSSFYLSVIWVCGASCGSGLRD